MGFSGGGMKREPGAVRVPGTNVAACFDRRADTPVLNMPDAGHMCRSGKHGICFGFVPERQPEADIVGKTGVDHRRTRRRRGIDVRDGQ